MQGIAITIGLLVAGVILAVKATVRLVRSTWRRAAPFYWAGVTILVACVAHMAGWPVLGPALLGMVGAAALAGLPAAVEVRVYRGGLVAVHATVAAVVASSGHWRTGIVVATWVSIACGWPWWRSLRNRPTSTATTTVVDEPEPEPLDDMFTRHWATEWEERVVKFNIAKGSEITRAVEPRPGVVDLTMRIPRGSKVAEVAALAPRIESCFDDLDEGSCGITRTGKSAWLTVSIVTRSYIAGIVADWGPTWDAGAIDIVMHANGERAPWRVVRHGFGALHGLVVGSTGAGKSRALGKIIEGTMSAMIPVVVLDCQDGQSLPDWDGAVSEYHAGVDACIATVFRIRDEIVMRSRVLAALKVKVFDPRDPRCASLGWGYARFVVDECQLILARAIYPEVVAAMRVIIGTGRKVGIGVDLATQIPQMGSLGGEIPIRDGCVAGNLLMLRLSNSGSQDTIVPPGFVGNAFGIPREDINGDSTAGMGYLGTTRQVGMIARVPLLDEEAAAATCPHVPMTWLAQPVEPGQGGGRKTTSAAEADTSSASRLAAAFGVAPPRPRPTTPQDWVLVALDRAPQSAQALVSRPDCPVGQSRLYALLGEMATAGVLVRPESHGGVWGVAEAATVGGAS